MGPVLVFDLDETLVATEKKFVKGMYMIRTMKLNTRIFQIIKRAMALRLKGKVDAILLLTNNTNVPSIYGDKEGGFLDIADLRFKEEYNVGMDDIFDMVYTGEKGRRGLANRTYNLVPYRPFGNKPGPTAWSGSPNKPMNYRPQKNIATVMKMLSEIPGKNVSLDNLEDRIFFFDDEPREHTLKSELDGHGGAYITIVPPFGKGPDTTDLSPIELALASLERGGGTRRLRRNRKRTMRR